MNTLYWYDLETFGTDTRRDRIAQFAGLRTDENLNPLGKPLVLYCRPSDDYLPDPAACFITGISPQAAKEKGVIEAQFVAQILEEFAQPNTCVLGYNNLRFDDEVLRHTFFRTLHDPYGREWQGNNSRWDIIDVARMTRALRPEGIEWPNHPEGGPSFRLEDLTAANGIAHIGAHDALVDVEATLAMARLLRDRQPKLFDFLFRLRKKQAVLDLIRLDEVTPLVHSSGMFSAANLYTSVVAPIAKHPVNGNEIIALDLLLDPGPLLELPVEDIHRFLFTRRDELPEGSPRIPVKTLHTNRCPALAPAATLAESADRLAIDLDRVRKHLAEVRDNREHLASKLQEIYRLGGAREPETEVELTLYGGPFLGDADRRRLAVIRDAAPEKLASLATRFDDPRLEELFFRYRARNWPQLLNEKEIERWREHRKSRLAGTGGWRSCQSYQAMLDELIETTPEHHHEVLQTLFDYGEELCDSF